MTRLRTGQIARVGICLIMAGVAIYGLLGLISAAEAGGTIARGNPGPVPDGSTHTYDGCIAQFLNIGQDTVDSLVPYIGGGIVLVLVAGLLLVYRKYPGDNNHGVIIVEN